MSLHCFTLVDLKRYFSRTQYYSADGFVLKEYFHFVKIQIIIVILNISSMLAFTL